MSQPKETMLELLGLSAEAARQLIKNSRARLDTELDGKVLEDLAAQMGIACFEANDETDNEFAGSDLASFGALVLVLTRMYHAGRRRDQLRLLIWENILRQSIATIRQGQSKTPNRAEFM